VRPVVAVLLLSALLAPSFVWAFSFGTFFKDLVGSTATEVNASTISTTSETMPFLDPAKTEDPKSGIGGAVFQYEDENALYPVIGPLGNVAEADETRTARISTYVVREGDNLSVIAKTFGVSIGTIFWANDIKSANLIRPGDELVILPVTGAKHIVKKGETVESIAKKYKGDVGEILVFNELTTAKDIEIGQELVIPNVELDVPRPTQRAIRSAGGSSLGGYFTRPITGGRRTQGVHGYNGVDLASYCGAPVYAAASGTVVIARGSGWNGGYGQYVVIEHPNGVQTLYSHESSVWVRNGQWVVQGQQIGTMGSTGRSTGCHVHFEVRGAQNPF